MSENNLTDNLWTALLMARGEIHPIAKRAENPHFGSRYADLASIVEAVVPVLARHGLLLLQPVGRDQAGGVVVSTDVVHVPTMARESLATVCVPLQRADAQAVGSAITYARRYGIAAGLCLSIDDDDDGEADVGRTQAPRRRAEEQRHNSQPAPSPVPPPPPPAEPGSVVQPPSRPAKDWRIPAGGKNGGRVQMSQASPEHLERFAQWLDGRIAAGLTKSEYADRDREQVELARQWAAWLRYSAATEQAQPADEPPPPEEPPF